MLRPRRRQVNAMWGTHAGLRFEASMMTACQNSESLVAAAGTTRLTTTSSPRSQSGRHWSFALHLTVGTSRYCGATTVMGPSPSWRGTIGWWLTQPLVPLTASACQSSLAYLRHYVFFIVLTLQESLPMTYGKPHGRLYRPPVSTDFLIEPHRQILPSGSTGDARHPFFLP